MQAWTGDFEGWLAGVVEWSNQLWVFVFDHLWQATLFGILAWFVVWLLREAPARSRHAVWLIAFVKFLIPTAWIVFLIRLTGYEAPGFMASILRFFNPSLGFGGVAEPSSVSLLLTGVWLAGSLFLFGRWLVRYRRVLGRIRKAQPVTSGREALALGRARARSGIENRVSLVLCDEMDEPGVWGVFRPIVTLPKAMTAHLNDQELEAIILHELTHVSRRDNLISFVTLIVCCLLWFHPLVWWMDRRTLAERERACDDQVLQYLGTSRVYAQSLLKVVRFRLGSGLAGFAGAAGSNLGRRIERILAGRPSSPLALWQRGAVALLASLLLMLSMPAQGGLDSSKCRQEEVTAKSKCLKKAGQPRPKVKTAIKPELPGQDLFP